MHCLIISNNPSRTLELKRQLKACELVASVQTAEHFYQTGVIFQEYSIDVVFIPVKLWNYRWLENVSYKPAIVFLTQKKERLFKDPNEVMPLYLHETATVADVLKAVESVEFGKGVIDTHFILIRYERRIMKICFDDIELIEKKTGGYYVLYTTSKAYLLAGTMTSILSQLPEKRFERIADELIIPATSRALISGDVFNFRGRKIDMNYKYMRRIGEVL